MAIGRESLVSFLFSQKQVNVTQGDTCTHAHTRTHTHTHMHTHTHTHAHARRIALIDSFKLIHGQMHLEFLAI